MNAEPFSNTRFGWSSLTLGAYVFFLVFLGVVVSVTLITFILPEAWDATTRIRIQRNTTGTQPPSFVDDPYFAQTEAQIIQSELVLGKVVNGLDLNTVWGQKYTGGEKLMTKECVNILKTRLELRPIHNTSVIGIRVFSEDRAEAATIANKIAEVYADYA